MGGTSADGRHAVFTTDKPLDPADTDTSIDVYDNFNGVNVLVSTGPTGGNGAFPANFDFVSQDGSKIVFETNEALTTGDTDNARDVYQRSAGGTTLVSRGPAGTNAAVDSFYEGSSADASKIFFGTVESLVSADTDSYFDTYERLNGTSAVLMTTSPTGGNGAFAAEFAGASQDGSRVFFETAEKLTGADTDTTDDIYERVGNATTLLSIGSGGGNGGVSVDFDGTSADGTKVFFSTFESLVSADTDTGQDIYQSSGGVTTLMTSGTAAQADDYTGNTPDGNHLYFQSQARLTTSDTDSFIDVYDSMGGTITLVSTGHNDANGSANTYYAGNSTNASHVFIRTDEPLVAPDTDTVQDVFDVSGGSTTLVSTGPAGGNGAGPALFAAASDDGTRVFFETYESLVSSDTDTNVDVYERTGGTTTLLSTGSTGGNSAVDARFRSATVDGGRVFFRTTEPLVPGDTDSASDVYSADAPGQVVIKKDAVPDDPQDFTFTIGGGLSLGLAAPPGQTTFQLDDDADATLSNTQTFPNVAPGTGYSVTESATTGWDPGGATCDNGSTPANIQVDAGKTTTCTFTNNKRGKIVVAVDAQPDDPQDFAFTAGGGLSPATFLLDDDANPTLSNTQTLANVAPGSGYSVGQNLPSGWDLTSATCSDGSPVTNINVSANETVTCTFVNRKRAQVVALLDSQPDDPQDVSFTAGGGLSPSGFSLDDDSDPALPNSQTFNDVVPGSGYTLSQTVPTGWDQTGATCDNGSPVTNITAAAGATVTCTFTNRKRGKVVVVEDSQPDDAQDFTYTAGGGLSPTSFSLDDDANATLSNTQTFNNVVPGSGYTVAQGASPSGWDLASPTCDNGSAISNINVAAGQTVTCSFVNKKRGSLTVILDTVPNDGQDFSFAAGGGLSPTSFILDDDNNPTRSNTQAFTNVVAQGGYSIAMTAVTGFDLTTATCSNGSPVSNITIAGGQSVTCTFTVNKRARVTVVKDAQPDDAQDFAFAATGLTPSTFSLDDDANGTLSNSQVFNNVAVGSGYAVSETVPSGWDQSSATCSDGSPVTNIDVSAGEQVTCTFVNKKRGSLTIVDDSQPDDPQDFSYTAGGGLSPTSFSLDDDTDTALSNTRTFSNLAAASGYTVAQTAVAGWTSTSSCTNGSTLANITVNPGESVTCTVTNKRNGTIVAIKDAQPNDPQDFSFTAGGGLSPASFSLDDDSDPALSNTRTFSNIVPQSGYSLAETIPGGWDQTSAICSDGSPVSNINVAPNESITCTFTNRKRGTIVLIEDSLPNDPQDFAFLAGGGLSPSTFSLDDDSDPTLSNTRTFTNVVAGTYGISEAVPGGWDQTGATCDNGSALSGIDVSAGETVTCTVTNRKRGNVIVVKDAVPNDPQDFSFAAGGGLSPSSFQLDDDSDPALSNTRTFSNVIPGSGYSVGETVPSGWDQTGASCDDGSPVSNVGVAPGETVACTFTNTKHARLTITKDAQPDDPQDFSFTAGGGLSPSGFSLDDDSDPALVNSQAFDDIAPGTYSVSESGVAGWDLTSATCDDGSPVSAIALAPGESVNCTFTNRKRGNLVVVESSTPNDPQDFSYTAGGGLSPSSFSLDDDSDPALSNTRSFSSVTPGTYSLSQDVPSGWLPASATCDDGSPVSSVAIAAGETVTCTFSNTKRGKIVVSEGSQPNDPQDFAFTAGGGLSPAGFSLDDDSDGTLSSTRTFSDLTPASGYSLDETVPGGWDLTDATCDDGSPISNIDVSPGETVNCSFANRKRGKVIAVKDALPNDPQDFSFDAGGGLSPSSFSLDDDSDPALSNTHTFTDVVPGSGYSLGETEPSGWDQTGATCSDGSLPSNIDVGAGETVTCTFTNTKRAQLTVTKDAQPDDPQDFLFTTGGGLSPSTFSLDDDSDPTLPNTQTFSDITPGTYSVNEGPASGWDLSAATCSDSSPAFAIDVNPGEHVTCTFTNFKRGNLVIVDDSVPDNAQDFSYTAGGGLSPSSFSLDDDSDPALSNTRTFAGIPVGSYSISQNSPSGWGLDNATCDNGSSASNIDVGPGETVTCTFTNKQSGKIIAVKNAQPNDPQDFSFSAGGGLSPSSFSLDDDSDPALSNAKTFADLTPTSGYSLSETVPSGWDQTGASCDDGSPVSAIDVSPGEIITCTFTNRKRGKIVIVKDAQPNDAQDFAFTADGGLSPSSFSLDDDSDPALSNTETFANVVPGSGYSFAETLPTGWSQASASCGDGSPVTNVDVSAGETITCTFANVHGYPRPKGASPFRASLVPAYRSCTAPSSSHGAPLSYPSCKPPLQTSSRLTTGTPDANGSNANMVAGLRMDVVVGNPGTPENEADIRFAFNMSDVRNASDLNDYTGELAAIMNVRLTDRRNGPTGNEIGTVSDFPFQYTVPCTPTSTSTTGATCTLATTANAVMPGAIVETQRSIWELGDMQVFDGGPDGVASTSPNTLFARQGVFVP